MRVSGIPNKYEILQEYYYEINGEDITYNEAITRYYQLDDNTRTDFLNYYDDYCKEYYGDDSIEYTPLDENGYGWRHLTDEQRKNSKKSSIRLKYSIEAFAKKQGMIIDPQWAVYSAEEIIQMEDEGVNIPKEVLEIAHSIYESNAVSYISTTTDAEDEATSEKEPFLDLVPKAAKKIDKCEENNEKISDAVDELLPEKREAESIVKDRMKKQLESLQEYEDLIREWNQIQTKVNNGEALSDKEAQRYAELTGMFEEKESNSDDSGFNIDKNSIARSLNEINIYAALGEELADETIEVADNLADYTSKTNYKTTSKSISNEIGFLASIIAMAKGKSLAKEAGKVGNNTKEYSSDTKQSVNDIASILDIKDQITTETPQEKDSTTGTGAVQETDPESQQAKDEARLPGVTNEEEDFVITDENVLQLINEAQGAKGDLAKQLVHAAKSIKVSKSGKTFAKFANLKVTKLVKQFKEEKAEREDKVAQLEDENKQSKKSIEDITGQSEAEIDEEVQGGKEDDPEKYNGMEESDKSNVDKNKQNISENNQEIETLSQEDIQAQEEFKQNTAKEKRVIDEGIPTETENLATNTEYDQEIIPAYKEQLEFTKNTGTTLKRIGKYRFKLGLNQGFIFSRKGILNMVKGLRSMSIGKTAENQASSFIVRASEKMTSKAVSDGTETLNSLNEVNNQIVQITGEDTPQGQTGEDSQQSEEQQQQAQNGAGTVATGAASAGASAESTTEVQEQDKQQADTAIQAATGSIQMQEPQTGAVPVSAMSVAKNMEQSVKEKEETGKSGAVKSKVSSGGKSSSSEQIPEISKDNAKSEASKGQSEMNDSKSDVQKDNQETKSITRDEEKSEQQLEKDAKKLQKNMKKEAKDIQKRQKESERIQKQQEQIIARFEELSVQNEQLTAEAQAAAQNPATQPAAQPQGQQQGGGLLASNSSGQAPENPVVQEKVAMIESNNQIISGLGRQFTSNDRKVQRNLKAIKKSQKYIKTTSKRFEKITKLKEKKATERQKAEEEKQAKLQKRLGIVGIFEKVFGVVTSVGSLLMCIPGCQGLGTTILYMGIRGTLLCAVVKAAILIANGDIKQALMTLGMSIATAALSMVGAGAAATGALQIASASLNVVSSAASLGASVQEFRGKDSGILGSIATIAGAASAITGAANSFSNLGKAGSNLAKTSQVFMQAGSITSTTGQMINQVRQWQGKEGDSKVANILGYVGMGLTIAGSMGNMADKISQNRKINQTQESGDKSDKGDKTDKTDNKDKTDKENKTEKNKKDDNKTDKTDKDSDNKNDTAAAAQSTADVSSSTESTPAEEAAMAEPDTELGGDMQQQAEELKSATAQDPSQATQETVDEINQTAEANSNPNKKPPEQRKLDDLDPDIFKKPETPQEKAAAFAKATKAAGVDINKKFDKTTVALDTEKLNALSASIQANAKPKTSFLDKAQPYLKALGAGAQLATSLMSGKEESNQESPKKQTSTYKESKRIKEIKKKRRKRLQSLQRYFANR